MGATVIVNFRTVVHKDSNGVSTSLPDVNKTPAPPGPPVPIPYPNIAQSSDTDKGSKKVKCDGNSIMLKDAEFKTSTGDEAGTLKGIVSSTNKGQAKFVLYSFDVKVEGRNVPRLGDPMTTNGNAPNSGHPAEGQPNLVAVKAALQDIVCQCAEEVNGRQPPTENCLEDGNAKHECCDKKIDEHRQKNPPNGDPPVQGEMGYDPKTGQSLGRNRAQIEASAMIQSALGCGGDVAAFVSGFFKTYFSAIGGKAFPDAAALDADGNPAKLYDFKFQCPKGKKSGKGESTGTAIPDWTPPNKKKGTPGQKKKYEKLSRKLGIDPNTHPPELVKSTDCN